MNDTLGPQARLLLLFTRAHTYALRGNAILVKGRLYIITLVWAA